MGNDAVYFTAESALQLARRCRPGKGALAPRKTTLPERSPRKAEITDAIASIRQSYPGFEFIGPISVLSGSPTRSRIARPFKVRYCRGTIPSSSFWCVARGVFAASPPFALMQIAARPRCRISLIRLIWETCGSYQTAITGHDSSYQIAPLTSVADIERHLEKCKGMNGSRALGDLMKYARDDSASPRETQLALLLGLPARYGGYGLGIPRMNVEARIDGVSRGLAERRSLKCDLCWQDKRLDVEYQSDEMHSGEKSRISDSRRANALESMGWTVIGVTNDELESLTAMNGVARSIAKRLGKRGRVRIDGYEQRKMKLRRQLGLPIYSLSDVMQGAWLDG